MSDTLEWTELRMDRPNDPKVDELKIPVNYQEVQKCPVSCCFRKGRPESKCFGFDLDVRPWRGGTIRGVSQGATGTAQSSFESKD